MNDIPLSPVTGSSLIAADGWSPDSKTLRVQFHNGKKYDFHGLSPETKTAYEGAPSKGQYLKRSIEPNIKGTETA